jgi:hypothetical protein
MLECGDFHFGAACFVCRRCEEEKWVPLSCAERGFCPSCHAKRQLLKTEFVLEQVLFAVGHRQWTFTIPKVLRRKRLHKQDKMFRIRRPRVSRRKGLSDWQRLIFKVYGTDPKECPKCHSQMELVAIVFSAKSLQRIIAHLKIPGDLPVFKPARAPPEEDPWADVESQEAPAAANIDALQKNKKPKTLEELLKSGWVVYGSDLG